MTAFKRILGWLLPRSVWFAIAAAVLTGGAALVVAEQLPPGVAASSPTCSTSRLPSGSARSAPLPPIGR